MSLITPQEIMYQAAHKDDDRSSALYVTAGIMIVLPAMSVALRLASRKRLKLSIAMDDISIILALVLCWGLCVMLVLCGHFGSGRHTILAGVDKLEHFLQVEYAFELTYAVAITLIKVSILLFYRRVFPTQSTSKQFKVAWWAIITWCILWCISVLFTATFQCLPASYFWTKVTMTTRGSCLNITALLISTAVLNIVTDVAILVLPMPIVWHLKIKTSQKVGVSGIFLLGGFVCVASITRACYLSEVTPTDPLWTNLNGGIWSVIEPGVGIIAASLPAIGAVVRKMVSFQRMRSSLKSLANTMRLSGRSNRPDPEKGDVTDNSDLTHRSESYTRKYSQTQPGSYKSSQNSFSDKPTTGVDILELQDSPTIAEGLRVSTGNSKA